MNALGNRILESEASAGNDVCEWGMSGYSGLKCGSVQLGHRADSSIIRLGSGVAFDNWLNVYHAAENFSRLDLQITARSNLKPKALIQRSYRDALKFSAQNGGMPRVSILKSSNGTATMYLGRRQSERFSRVYDKGAESGLDYFANSTRFEVELKGALCLPSLRVLSDSYRPMHAAAQIVLRHFRDRGLSLSMKNTTDRALSAPRRRSDQERRLEWLRKQVRPTVQALVAAVGLASVENVLGLREQSTMASRKFEKLKLVAS